MSTVKRKQGLVMDILLGVLLAVVAAAAICWFLANASPNESQFTVASENTGTGRLTTAAVLGGTETFSAPELNRLIADALTAPSETADPALVSVRVATGGQEKSLYVCAHVRVKQHTWVVTAVGTVEPLLRDGVVTGLAFTPQQVSVGRLRLPKAVWASLATHLPASELVSYDNGVLNSHFPALPVTLTALSVQPEGIVVTVRSVFSGLTDLWQGGASKNNGTSSTDGTSSVPSASSSGGTSSAPASASGDNQTASLSAEKLQQKAAQLLEDAKKRLLNGSITVDQLMAEWKATLPEEELTQMVAYLREQLAQHPEWLTGSVSELGNALSGLLGGGK